MSKKIKLASASARSKAVEKLMVNIAKNDIEIIEIKVNKCAFLDFIRY
jgi:hypothetical protein